MPRIMTNHTAQVVVSLSGGMDSAVCAALAVRDYGADNVAALHISYGQRTEAREQTSFLGICEALGIHRRLIVKTPFFRCNVCSIFSSAREVLQEGSPRGWVEPMVLISLSSRSDANGRPGAGHSFFRGEFASSRFASTSAGDAKSLRC